MKSYILFILTALYSQAYPWPEGPSGPPTSFTKYDQRQEGDWNLRADLENFVILVIPASTSQVAPSSPSMSGTLSLLDLLTKAVPWRRFKRKHIKKPYQNQQQDELQEVPLESETQQFIESKTAPYHVDISKSKANLAKLYPTDVMLIAKSPKVTLLKDSQEDAEVPLIGGRLSRAFVFSMPLHAEQARNQLLDYEYVKNKDGGEREFAIAKATNELCGPKIMQESAKAI